MNKYGVFIRFDVETDTAEGARECVEDILSSKRVDLESNITNWEVYEVEEA